MKAPDVPAYGADPSRYQFIPRVLVFVTHGDALLLIRRAEHKRLWPGKYNAPGGHVERGEDPYAAALRELAEETGVEVAALRLRGLIVAETGLAGSGVLVFVYQGEATGTVLKGGDEGEPRWVQREALAELPLLADLPRLVELVLDRSESEFFYLVKTPRGDGGEDEALRSMIV